MNKDRHQAMTIDNDEQWYLIKIYTGYKVLIQLHYKHQSS